MPNTNLNRPDLNEQTVLSLLKWCSVTDSTQMKVGAGIRLDEHNRPEVLRMLDDEKRTAAAGQIRYLVGQLAVIHSGSGKMSLEDGMCKYDGTKWTSNKDVLLAFYLLACSSAHGFLPFFQESTGGALTASLLGASAVPTLSPSDEHFAEGAPDGGYLLLHPEAIACHTELSEQSVLALFKTLKASKNCSSVLLVSLSEGSAAVKLDRRKAEGEFYHIFTLLNGLAAVAEGKEDMLISEAYVRRDGQCWTKNPDAVLALCLMGCAFPDTFLKGFTKGEGEPVTRIMIRK